MKMTSVCKSGPVEYLTLPHIFRAELSGMVGMVGIW